MTKSKSTPLTNVLLETAKDMRRVEVLPKSAYAKITNRHLGHEENVTAQRSSRSEVGTARERSK